MQLYYLVKSADSLIQAIIINGKYLSVFFKNTLQAELMVNQLFDHIHTYPKFIELFGPVKYVDIDSPKHPFAHTCEDDVPEELMAGFPFHDFSHMHYECDKVISVFQLDAYFQTMSRFEREPEWRAELFDGTKILDVTLKYYATLDAYREPLLPRGEFDPRMPTLLLDLADKRGLASLSRASENPKHCPAITEADLPEWQVSLLEESRKIQDYDKQTYKLINKPRVTRGAQNAAQQQEQRNNAINNAMAAVLAVGTGIVQQVLQPGALINNVMEGAKTQVAQLAAQPYQEEASDNSAATAIKVVAGVVAVAAVTGLYYWHSHRNDNNKQPTAAQDAKHQHALKKNK